VASRCRPLPDFDGAAVLRFLKATRNSWNGLIACARSEEAFRQELIALAIAVPLAFIVATDAWRRMALIGVVVLLMIVELLNTAIEKLSDHVTPHHHDAIGRIKDMASAAVGLSLLLAGVVWLIALAERFGLL
jgi:diacylglycerol kinase (ATP)